MAGVDATTAKVALFDSHDCEALADRGQTLQDRGKERKKKKSGFFFWEGSPPPPSSLGFDAYTQNLVVDAVSRRKNMQQTIC
jgi:hypothetical protein